MNPSFETFTPVSQIMSQSVVSVSGKDLMSRVRHLFSKHGIHHMPVTDDDGKLIGILSSNDLNKVLHGFTLFKTKKSVDYNEAVLNSLLVEEVMHKKVVTLSENDPISRAADIFKENLFHCLPVIDQDGNLQGIITTYDLIVFAYG